MLPSSQLICDIHHSSIALRGGGLNLSQSRMPSDMREAFALLDSGRGWKEAQKRRYIRQKKRQSARSSRDYIIHWWIGASLGSRNLHSRRKAVRSNLYKRSRSPRGAMSVWLFSERRRHVATKLKSKGSFAILRSIEWLIPVRIFAYFVASRIFLFAVGTPYSHHPRGTCLL